MLWACCSTTDDSFPKHVLNAMCKTQLYKLTGWQLRYAIHALLTTSSWMVHLIIVVHKEGWACRPFEKQNLYRSTPKSTQRNQCVRPYMYFTVGLTCCVNRSCIKRQLGGVPICRTPLRSVHKKKRLKAGLLSTVQSDAWGIFRSCICQPDDW